MTHALSENAPGAAGGAFDRSRVFNAQLLTSLGPLIALVLACAYFASQSDRFFTGSNISLIIQQSMVVAILAIGQTLIILTAGIDLSIGAVMALGTIVMTKLAVQNGVNPYLAILLGVLTCAGFGLANGLLITRLRLPPFIVTLGTLNIAYALTHIYSEEQTITKLPAAQTWLRTSFTIGETRVPYSAVLMFILYLMTWYVLRQTASGRHIYAIGNNPEAARLTGINVRRMLVYVYTIAGVFYGIAGMVIIARTQVGNPQEGQTDNLDSITAVVLGGTSLFGGRGGVMGTLIGALLVGIFRNGLQLTGVASIYQRLITGILVILAVSVDQLARRRQG
ncbi:MAG: Fructose ABC transporter, permease component FrcC [uncultured Thermomicrobiales bacterium]|uniref:Fructose ABC transporter, permease component FrcC n=1 Tax=uncultured Thermomicrobiales bacterium TaxID=1645740 RepID=A0A6J4V0G2_9BACT|nr:MAG: Fructose ABC transporter, permease component FrcC [uncultured Thermomicrobiales bacterium]